MTPNFCYKITKEPFDPTSISPDVLKDFAVKQGIIEHIFTVLEDNDKEEIVELYSSSWRSSYRIRRSYDRRRLRERKENCKFN